MSRYLIRVRSFECRIAMLVSSLCLAAQVAAADPVLSVTHPYQGQLSDPVTHEVDFTVVVTPPYQCDTLKVWLPLPPSDNVQQASTQHLSSFPMQVEPQIHTEAVHGNRFAYFEFLRPQGAQIIRHRFTAKIWQVNWQLDLQRVANVATWPEAFTPHLAPPAMQDTDQFSLLIRGFRERGPQAAGDLIEAMRWIESNMTYDHANASLQADPNLAFRDRRGHCSDYHGLCATMGRALGYPTRITYGLSLIPKNSPSHCKLEVYLPPYGWISFDLSETQKMLVALENDQRFSDERRSTLMRAVRDRLFSGFRENSWLLMTRGSNYELAPPASRPVAVVRTIYAEADGQPLPEPDPANVKQREFAWMTAHKYEADKPFVKYTDLEPFLDEGSLVTPDGCVTR